jgi:hypothetical protein
MPSDYVNDWINQTQDNIDYWFDNYLLTPNVFNITPLPNFPIISPNILNHNLTSCCPVPNFPEISFEHFPEPYYGNPDDDTKKFTVVLFYNPGPQVNEQSINARGNGTFYNNYYNCNNNYYNLSSELLFCDVTINRFLVPKMQQLNNLFQFIPHSLDIKPLFMDLIPWHSNKFSSLHQGRFCQPQTLSEFKTNVILPAVLNAKNSFVTDYINSISNNKNKIILFAIGALYTNQNYLHSIGFNNITANIPNHQAHVNNNNIIVAGNNSKITIWHINSNKLLNDHSKLAFLANKEIYIINMWTPNIGMNIPQNITMTMEHIFNNL